MNKRYKIKKGLENLISLCKNFGFEFYNEPYKKFVKTIITPLHRIRLETDEQMRLFMINELTNKKKYEIPEFFIKDLIQINMIEEDYISMEDFALENCPKCSNYTDCIYQISKRIDGNANCVYFKEKNNE